MKKMKRLWLTVLLTLSSAAAACQAVGGSLIEDSGQDISIQEGTEAVCAPEETEPVFAAEETEPADDTEADSAETEASGETEDNGEDTGNTGLSEAQLAREYRWLEKHADDFPAHKIEYAKNNPGLIDFLYRYEAGQKESRLASEEPSGLTEEEENMYAPVLLQWDDRWGFHPYGSSVMGLTGCGPACLAIVINSLAEDQNVTPADIADFATEHDLYEYGVGTSWGLWHEGAQAYGLEEKTVAADYDIILGELKDSALIVCSVGPGVFTPGGHFIVIAGQKEGQLEIRDPNNLQNSSRLWDWEEFADQIKHCWSFKAEN